MGTTSSWTCFCFFYSSSLGSARSSLLLSLGLSGPEAPCTCAPANITMVPPTFFIRSKPPESTMEGWSYKVVVFTILALPGRADYSSEFGLGIVGVGAPCYVDFESNFFNRRYFKGLNVPQ